MAADRRLAIAISGGLGSGKGFLAKALADRIGGACISFGAEVRRAVAEMGEDPSNLDRLQVVGQALVVTDCPGLVDRTLAQAAGSTDAPLVIAGLRHVEVLWELRQRLGYVHLVHVDTPDEVRAGRLMQRESMERRLVARFDNALSEAQSTRILPQYANVTVYGALPVDLQVARVVSWLGLKAADAPPARAVEGPDAA